jgi:hypothetical protein
MGSIIKKSSIALISLFICFLNSTVEARLLFPSSSPSGKTKELYMTAALKAGYGQNASADESSVVSRNLFSYSIEAGLGMKFYSHYILGIDSELGVWKQLTKPSSVGNINTQGNLKALYPIFGFEFGRLVFIAKFPCTLFLGKYDLDKTTAAEKTVVFTSPDAFALQVHWLQNAIAFWGIEYQQLTFDKAKQNGVEIKLNSSSEFKMKSLSFLYGIYY